MVKKDEVVDLLNHVDLTIIPTMNPDGFKRRFEGVKMFGYS